MRLASSAPKNAVRVRYPVAPRFVGDVRRGLDAEHGMPRSTND